MTYDALISSRLRFVDVRHNSSALCMWITFSVKQSGTRYATLDGFGMEKAMQRFFHALGRVHTVGDMRNWEQFREKAAVGKLLDIPWSSSG